MTTVDVYVTYRGERQFSLHNGLFGPATTVFHRLVDAIKAGDATGDWDGASAKAELTGAVLRQLINGLGDTSDSYQPVDEAALIDSLDDRQLYEVKAIEF